MRDETAPAAAKEPWFVVRARSLADVLLYDEDATRRWLGTGILGLGVIVASGGAPPGWDWVVPIVSWIPPKFGLPIGGVGAWLLGKSTSTKKEGS